MVRTKPTLITMGALCGAMILSLTLSGGCSRKQKSRPATTARLEREIQSRYGINLDLSEPRRSLAEGGPRCYSDRFTPEQIRAEVARKEAAAQVPPISAKAWDGVDLSSFPPAQASYLLRNSDWIHTQGMDFSSCTDVGCIVDTIYGKPGGIEGWLNYGYFLETGYMLSLERKFADPDQNFAVVEKQLDIRNYPFTEPRLYGLWRVSGALPEIYHFMSDLQSIHQVPAGNYPLQWYPKNPDGTLAKDPTICGVSYGNYLQGIILLRDSCLDMSNPAFDFTDFSYTYVAHEMTHRLDYLVKEGDMQPNDVLSESSRWTGFSGWYKQTVTDPATGKATYHWKTDRPISAFVRDYAATNPLEDFAETTAWYRMHADQVLQKEPEKFAYLRDKIFGGRDYSHAGLLQYYGSEIFKAADSAVLEVVQNCASGSSPSSSQSAAPSDRLQIDLSVSPSILACVERGLESKMATAGDSLRYNEPEACGILDQSEPDLRTKAFQNLANDVKGALAKQAAVSKALKASQDLHDALAAQVDPREAFLHCQKTSEDGRSPSSDQQSPESCFNAELTKAFDRVGNDFAGALGDLYANERARYLDDNTFQKTAARVAAFYQGLFAGIDPALQQAAGRSWDACVNEDIPGSPAPSPVALPSGSPVELPVAVVTAPFSGGSHFVSAGILNCVNAAVFDDIRPMMSHFLDRLGLSISDPDVRRYAEGLLLPTYLTVIQSRAERDEANEDQQRDSRKSGVLDVLTSGLGSNRDWLKGQISQAGALDRCDPAAAAIFDSYFGKVSPEQKLPVHFASWADLRADWSHQACVKVVSDNPEISGAIDDAFKTAFSQAASGLDSFVLARAQETGLRCMKDYPYVKHFWSPDWARRRVCLKRKWNPIETAAVSDWKASLSQKALGDDPDSIARYLASHRRRLQNSAIRQLNSEYK